MPTVSISILIKDEVQMLPYTIPCYASLQGLLKEVVFVDDCSTDGSKEKAFDIASKFRHLPIVWKEHEMQRWDEQRNIGIESCTGDFILTLDADMGFTGNLGHLIEKGYFNENDVWDFRTYSTRWDLYHHDEPSYGGLNRTTRLIKNCGVRYSGIAHEQPDVISEDSKTQIKTTSNSKVPSKGFCKEVHLLHLFALSTDDVLLERGARVVRRWSKQMTERGIAPGTEDRYLRFKYKNLDAIPINSSDVELIPTYEMAIKHWGK